MKIIICSILLTVFKVCGIQLIALISCWWCFYHFVHPNSKPHPLQRFYRLLPDKLFGKDLSAYEVLIFWKFLVTWFVYCYLHFISSTIEICNHRTFSPSYSTSAIQHKQEHQKISGGGERLGWIILVQRKFSRSYDINQRRINKAWEERFRRIIP